jgi:hypothetical protein
MSEVLYRLADGWRLDGSSRHKALVIGVDGLRWDRVLPDFLTVMKRRRPELATFAALSWPPLAEHGTFGVEADLVLTDDGETYGYRDADARLGAHAGWLPAGGDRGVTVL